MARQRGENHAFGKPGMEPRWTHGDKDGIGTAYSAASRLWFTVWNGIVTEVYFPTVDRPQLRDVQLLFTDGETFFHQETRYLETTIERMPSSLGYVVTGKDPEGRYSYRKEIIADPHQSCLLQQVTFLPSEAWRKRIRVYVLCAPHLDVGGAGNNAFVARTSGRDLLIAEKNNVWLTMEASVPFSRLSVGYVGKSDGWTDLAENYKLDWEFDQALDGNVALTGELPEGTTDFVLAIAFGHSQQRAVTTVFQSLSQPFEHHHQRFQEQWERTNKPHDQLEQISGDGGHLAHASYKLLLAHEDKTFEGALVASLAIPWGEAKNDEEGEAGYHLVWTRDLVQSAGGLLAAGNTETPLRSLIYLAASQKEDGSFAQNSWVDGTPYWSGIQLDEVALPILLAYRLWQHDALREFDPYVMVMLGAGFLIQQGPATRQERWEEASGYSPSTLAVHIAGLTCASRFAADRGDHESARFLQEFADWMEHSLELWTVTNEGTLLDGVPRHYVRLNPSPADNTIPGGDAGSALLPLKNQPPGEPKEYLAKEVVDAGFLELVRYGIRAAHDPIIQDSLRVVDASLKVETPSGVCWRRYNHDGYGQQANGDAYIKFGQGRGWPLLTGERGHYELAANRDVSAYIHDMERSATPMHLIPEQVWDEADRPDRHLKCGRPTGSAVPLMWAHAEYIKLLRSTFDGKVFDLVPDVAERYIQSRPEYHRIQFWSIEYQAKSLRSGETLRIQGRAACRVRVSPDGWKTFQDYDSVATRLGIEYCDIQTSEQQSESLRFTFFWKESTAWEGRDFEVSCVQR